MITWFTIFLCFAGIAWTGAKVDDAVKELAEIRKLLAKRDSGSQS